MTRRKWAPNPFAFQNNITPPVPPPPTYEQEVLADSPVGWWRLGESSGTIAINEVSAVSGTYGSGCTLGQPGLLAGDPGATSVLFDGSVNGEVIIPDDPSLDVGNTFSIELWLSRLALGNLLPYSKGNQGQLSFDAATHKLVIDNDSTVSAQESGSTIVDGRHHFVFTHTPGVTFVYKDGVDVTTIVNAATVYASNAFPLYIGIYRDGNYGPFNGYIQDVALYPTALSAARVLAHWDAGS